MKILSIDDSRSVHAYLSQCLQPSYFELIHAFCGEDGLSVLSKDASFDLILLDWEMPGMNGPQVVGKIKEMNLQIPIIMLTSKNDPDDIMDMLSMGVSEYVMKPFTSDILLEKIENVKGVAIPRDGTS